MSVEEEIRRTLALYCHFLDDGDAEAYADLFCEDGVLDAGPMGLHEGRSALRELVASLPVGRTRHFVSNERIDVDGESASVVSYLLVISSRREGGIAPGLAGRYEDQLRRDGGRWRFSRRRVHFDLRGDL